MNETTTRWPALPVADWPAGFRDRSLSTGAAFDPDLGEFVLPYRTVREAADPEGTLLAFLRETYGAAADLADWPSTA